MENYDSVVRATRVGRKKAGLIEVCRFRRTDRDRWTNRDLVYEGCATIKAGRCNKGFKGVDCLLEKASKHAAFRDPRRHGDRATELPPSVIRELKKGL